MLNKFGAKAITSNVFYGRRESKAPFRQCLGNRSHQDGASLEEVALHKQGSPLRDYLSRIQNLGSAGGHAALVMRM